MIVYRIILFLNISLFNAKLKRSEIFLWRYWCPGVNVAGLSHYDDITINEHTHKYRWGQKLN